MSDIIRLLPDAIANQIAAGEVIQRPASVVKELVENAVDAGSTDIKVIIKEAGKTLIRVVDNGTGMSEVDARMALERHATSKLRESGDLFAIKSKGFRGEALASIVAIARLELRTKQEEDEFGTRIVAEGSSVKVQEPCQCSKGTSIDVKSIFYNVPARRKFLKSDVVEFRHINDEFTRIAMAHPDIGFSLHHNNEEIHKLFPGNQRQRIVALLGKRFNDKLVPVHEETNYIAISGFVGKPETVRKTRGDQYLFANRRYIRSPYLEHAIRASFEDMIPAKTHPMYAIFLEIDPGKIDVNVHPTKQQIKFEDERLIYNYLRVTVRHALGKYSITPSLDFDQQVNFGQNQSRGQIPDPRTANQRDNLSHWQKLFEGLKDTPGENVETVTIQSEVFSQEQSGQSDKSASVPYQLHNTFLVSQIKSGILVIDQQSAHERILFEHFLGQIDEKEAARQQLLFPHTFELSRGDAGLMRDLLENVNALGFEVEHFGQESFIVHAVPSELESGQEEQVLKEMLEQFKSDLDPDTGQKVRIAKALGVSSARKRGEFISPAERQLLIDRLFACENPYTSPSGRKCFAVIELEELMQRFTKD